MKLAKEIFILKIKNNKINLLILYIKYINYKNINKCIFKNNIIV